jgi:hypothetical protein
MKRTKDLPESRRLYQYTIEITDLQAGSSRRVPLKSFRRVSLKTLKKSEVAEPPVDVLRFEDGDFQIEARDFEELRSRLREQYPDERYERRVHAKRDREAVDRREQAIEGLAKIYAEVALERLLAEAAADGGDAPSDRFGSGKSAGRNEEPADSEEPAEHSAEGGGE